MAYRYPYYGLLSFEDFQGTLKGSSINDVMQFEDFLTPLPLCHTKLPVLLRLSYKVSQKL